jgi:hypothetical protein
MRKSNYKIRAKIWLYPGPENGGNWHFVTLPKKYSAQIKKDFTKVKRGWGSLPVTVTIGPNSSKKRQASKTSWETSIFPDNKSGTYLLPLKSEVRKKEDIFEGETITFSIKIQA